MSVDVNWYDERRTFLVIGLTFPWNWSEVENSFRQSVELMDSVDHVVHLLVEFPSAGGRPQGNSLVYLKRIIRQLNAHPRAGVVYLVNPNPFARSIIEVLLRLYRQEAQRIHIVSSREEALRLGQAAS